MELIIDKDSFQERKRNCYEMIITFMFGDSNGEEDVKFYFSDKEYENPIFKEEVHEFIKHIKSCIEIDNFGRGGIQCPDELINWYNLGIDHRRRFKPAYKWGRYCEDSCEDSCDELGELFTYIIPANYDDGWYASYYDFEIKYYDNNGDMFNVIIED